LTFASFTDSTPPSRSGRRDSSVGIATGYRLDGPGLITGTAKFVSLSYPHRLQDRLWGLPSLFSNGYRGLFRSGVDWQGREADHSSLSSADVKNGGAIPPLPDVFIA
jgi:hypothetical protein